MMISRDRSDFRFALLVVLLGLIVGVTYYINLWKLDANGMSDVSQTLPYWDFTNLWAGGLLISKGNAVAVFDPEIYRATLRQIFSESLPNQEWSYPPSMLLLGAPLAQLPIGVAYLIWTLGTIGALHLSLRPFSLPPLAHIAILFSPSGMINALLGQNGALTAALLIGGLICVYQRPVLSGILLGLLTIKPHLGILLPICLLASGNYRAFLSAALTAAALFLVTGVVFGFDVWTFFATKTAPLMSAILEAPYPQTYHTNAITVFLVGRRLGFDLAGSYILQSIFLIASAVAVIWLWRPSNEIDHGRRVCLTATLAIVATPYGYSYDTIPMCVAAGFLFLTERRINRVFLALIWICPLFLHLLNHYGITIGIMAPIGLVASTLWLSWRDNRPNASAYSPALPDGSDRDNN